MKLSILAGALLLTAAPLHAQQAVTETRDPRQQQDPGVREGLREVDHRAALRQSARRPPPEGRGHSDRPRTSWATTSAQPKTLTYYADALKYYRALEKAAPRKVKIETIGKSDEGRELVVVWISSEDNIRNLATNRANLAKIADPRGMSEAQVNALINSTKPHYHLMGGLHSGEVGSVGNADGTGLSTGGRDVAADQPDPRQRVRVDHAAGRSRWPRSQRRLVLSRARHRRPAVCRQPRRRDAAVAVAGVPYWGKYVYHDNNRDINLSQMSMRAITDWYFTAHPPIMHDLHEAAQLMYTYSGGPPQNPNLDPILFAELPFFSNWEMSQMTKWGMPGVYTHAFMDGWSPGYLGSVAYNHNGMMRMYETQSGVDAADSAAAPADGRGGRARWC